MRLLVVLFALFLAGCKGEEESIPTCAGVDCPYELSHDCSDGDCTYRLYKGAQLEKQETQGGLFTSIRPGINNVLEMYFVYEDRAEIADDELSLYLRVEVPSSVSSFTWRDDVLTNQDIFYARLCFCADISAKKPYSGSIKGQRLDSQTWQIEADLLINYYDYPEAKPIRLQFSEVFEESAIDP